jgi:hypothetical protein
VWREFNNIIELLLLLGTSAIGIKSRRLAIIPHSLHSPVNSQIFKELLLGKKKIAVPSGDKFFLELFFFFFFFFFLMFYLENLEKLPS